MLDHTQNILEEEESEIKAKNLHTKPESELTSEEADLIRARESNVNHMAQTSANLLKMESESLAKDSSSTNQNVSFKRDVKSADLASSDKEDVKKSK